MIKERKKFALLEKRLEKKAAVNKMSTLNLKSLCSGLPLSPLPENRGRTFSIAHASKRNIEKLNQEERKVNFI